MRPWIATLQDLNGVPGRCFADSASETTRYSPQQWWFWLWLQPAVDWLVISCLLLMIGFLLFLGIVCCCLLWLLWLAGLSFLFVQFIWFVCLRWCFTIQQKSLVKRDSDSRIFIRDIPEVNHQPTSTTSFTLGTQNQQRKPIRFESHRDFHLCLLFFGMKKLLLKVRYNYVFLSTASCPKKTFPNQHAPFGKRPR